MTENRDRVKLEKKAVPPKMEKKLKVKMSLPLLLKKINPSLNSLLPIKTTVLMKLNTDSMNQEE